MAAVVMEEAAGAVRSRALNISLVTCSFSICFSTTVQYTYALGPK